MRVLGHTVIHEVPGRHLAFVGLCKRRATGELLVVFREGAGHVDPEGRILLMRSGDAGETWDGPEVVVDTEFDDRDPSIADLPDGRLLLNWFPSRCTTPWSEEQVARWIPEPWRELGRKNWNAVVSLTALRVSTDGGQTWSDVQSVHATAPPVSEPVCALPSGELLMPVYGRFERYPGSAAYLLRSRDGGETWGDLDLVAHDPAGEVPFGEPSFACIPDGTLICHLRTSGAKSEPGAVYQCESTDGGRAWTSPRKLALWEYPQSLLVLGDRDVLSVYGYRRTPMGIRAALSHDAGGTWNPSDELVLRNDGCHHDLGYPAAAQLDDDRVFVAYYINTGGVYSHIAGNRIEM